MAELLWTLVEILGLLCLGIMLLAIIIIVAGAVYFLVRAIVKLRKEE